MTSRSASSIERFSPTLTAAAAAQAESTALDVKYHRLKTEPGVDVLVIQLNLSVIAQKMVLKNFQIGNLMGAYNSFFFIRMRFMRGIGWKCHEG